jgi:sugar (pentulose or hexulose) kinase
VIYESQSCAARHYRTTTHEAAAVGAALLAGVGVGLYPDVQTACRRVVRLQEQVILPIPEHVAVYTEAYQKYCAIYPALEESFLA